MKYTTKPRKKVAYTLKAKIWHNIEYKEKSFKDLNNIPHFVQGKWYGKGYTDNGGKSRKCRYA
jgi:hypothetical protein